MNASQLEFSDFIVYADESGYHSLDKTNWRKAARISDSSSRPLAIPSDWAHHRPYFPPHFGWHFFTLYCVAGGIEQVKKDIVKNIRFRGNCKTRVPSKIALLGHFATLPPSFAIASSD